MNQHLVITITCNGRSHVACAAEIGSSIGDAVATVLFGVRLRGLRAAKRGRKLQARAYATVSQELFLGQRRSEGSVVTLSAFHSCSIDYYPRSAPTNFLFRGNMPAINGSFAYKDLVQSMAAAAGKLNLSLPSNFSLVDVR